MLSYDGILWASGILGVLTLLYFIYQSDEVPMLMAALYGINGLYRYFVVVINPNQRKVGWVVVAYSRNIFELNEDLALKALNYFLLGTVVFIAAYILTKALIGPPKQKLDIKPMLGQFMLQKRSIIVGLFALINIAVFYSRVFLVTRYNEDASFNTSTGVSYLLFLPFAIGGIIILMFLIWRSIDQKVDPTSRLVFLGLMIFAAWLSYNPGARFNFLSWVIALGIIAVGDRPIHFKVRLYTVGLFFLLVVYSIAGLARTPGAFLLPIEDQLAMAYERLETAEDQNLLDGFMMALQVYPDNLDFQYGFQHLEILLRPIPRALWPGKPLGGYANKLGLNDFDDGSHGLTIGISETIYGTFYGEAGVPGIVVLSFLYGAIFAWVMRRAERYSSDMRWLIKGMVIASLVALIRGGDLAGIVAFVGMSYWPVYIFMAQYGTYVKKFNAWFAAAMQAKRIKAYSKVLTQRDPVEAEPLNPS